MKVKRQRFVTFKFREVCLYARVCHWLGFLQAALHNGFLHLARVGLVLNVVIAPADDAIQCSGLLPVLRAWP